MKGGIWMTNDCLFLLWWTKQKIATSHTKRHLIEMIAPI